MVATRRSLRSRASRRALLHRARAGTPTTTSKTSAAPSYAAHSLCRSPSPLRSLARARSPFKKPERGNEARIKWTIGARNAFPPPGADSPRCSNLSPHMEPPPVSRCATRPGPAGVLDAPRAPVVRSEADDGSGAKRSTSDRRRENRSLWWRHGGERARSCCRGGRGRGGRCLGRTVDGVGKPDPFSDNKCLVVESRQKVGFPDPCPDRPPSRPTAHTHTHTYALHVHPSAIAYSCTLWPRPARRCSDGQKSKASRKAS